MVALGDNTAHFNILLSEQGAKLVRAEIEKTINTARKGANEINKGTNMLSRGFINQQKAISGNVGVVQNWNKASVASENITQRMIARKQQETDAYIMNSHTIDSNTGQLKKLSITQRIAYGQWKSAFPVLNQVNNALNTVRWTMVNVAFGLAAIAAITSPFILLTKSGIEYEEQLRKIASVSGELFQTQQGLNAIAGAVAGVAIGRPATFADAASAMLEFQRAGFSLTDAMRDVPHIIDLSVAGFVDLTDATKIVTSVLHQFSGEGLTAARAADTIAKAAVSSATTVEEFGNALGYVGAMAASAGFEFEETAAALALLSNAGMRGSRAGTTLRQVISKVSTMSRQGEESMNRLGLSFFNVEGNLKSLQEIFTQLSVVMTGMTQEERASFIGDMFEIRSRAGVSALLNIIEQSSGAIDDFSDILKDSGFSARTAADIQQASALRMRTAWGNLMVGLQPIAMSFNNLFTWLIKRVEEFSNRFLVAMRRGGITQAFGELPITVQLMALISTIKLAEKSIVSLSSKLTMLYAKQFVASATISSAYMLPQFTSAAPAMLKESQFAQAPLAQKPVAMHVPIMHFDKSLGKLPGTFNAAVRSGGLFRATVTSIGGALKKTGMALGGFIASMNPLILAAVALGGAFVVLRRAFRDASRQTQEQINVLFNYQTQIDILKAREDAFTQAFMVNSAARTRALIDEFEAQEEIFDKTTKDLNFMISVWEDLGDKPIRSLFSLMGAIKGVRAEFLSLKELGIEGLFMSTDERRDAVADILSQTEREHLNYQEQAIKAANDRAEAEERALYTIGGFTKLLIEDREKLAAYADGELITLIQSSKYYGDLLDIENERAQVKKDVEDKVISEEEATRRIGVLDRDRVSTIKLIKDENQLIASGMEAQMRFAVQQVRMDEARLETLRTMSGEINRIIQDTQRGLTPRADGLIKQFGDEDMIFGIGGTLDNMRKHIPEAREYIDRLINSFWDKVDVIQEMEYRYDIVSRAIEQFNRLIAIEEASLEGLNAQLQIHDDLITQLSNQRFVGETDLDKLILNVSQSIKQAELESMGIVDVYKFIQDAVGGVEGAFDGVIDAVRAVDDATKTSENTYDAWRTTVQEHIRALIVQGNDLAMSTSSAVKHHMTALQSVSKFKDEEQKQMTDEEIMLDALSKARDFYYGGMHSQVNLAIQAQEDLTAINNQTADTVIAALHREWDARRPIIEQIGLHKQAIKDLNTTHVIGGQTLSDYRKEQALLDNDITTLIEKIVGPGGLILAFDGVTESLKNLVSEFEELSTYLDLNMRPASFTEMDTPTVADIVRGFNWREATDITPPTNITVGDININGTNTDNPKLLGQKIASEIKRLLKVN